MAKRDRKRSRRENFLVALAVIAVITGGAWFFCATLFPQAFTLAIAVSIILLILAAWPVYAYFFPKKSESAPMVQQQGQAGIIMQGGSMRIGGNVTVTNYASSSPEGLEALVKSLMSPLHEKLADKDAKIEALARELGVREGAASGMLRTLGEKKIPLEQLSQKLHEIAARFKNMQEQLRALQSNDPEVRRLRQEAANALDADHYARAEELLEQAYEADSRAMQQQQQALDARKVSMAATLAVRGELAAARLDYPAAAAQYARAADTLPQDATDLRWRYLMRQADALYDQGKDFGDNPALAKAISLYRKNLSLRPRQTHPQDWAMTQNSLGLALQTLGARESGTAHLREAVAAYQDVLKEWTRKRAPLNWAMTQNNLGTALSTLGERESDTARLKKAVAAYRAALKERTRECVPLDWAMTQNNLGIALWALGRRESGTASLEKAVCAYRAVLKEWTRERVPLGWAMTQHNLAGALLLLVERSGESWRLEEALTCAKGAVEVFHQGGATYYYDSAKDQLRQVQKRLAAAEAL